MKVLHVIYTKGISGAEKYLMDLLPGLKKEGIDCRLVLVSPGRFTEQLQRYCERMESLGIPTTRISAGRAGFFFAAARISRYLKQHSIRMVHSHLFNTDLLVSLVKRFFYKKVFILSTKHGYSEKVLSLYTGKPLEVKHDLYYRLTRFTLKMIDRNISISDGISQLFIDIGFTRERYPVIPHGISIDPLPAKDAESAFRRSRYQLVIVGRLEEFKGHQYLLNALPEVVSAYPDLALLILGVGSKEESLKQQVRQLGLEKQVFFLGFCDDPYPYITNSDLIVMPSAFEPFGLVFIESFALKVPVLAFDTPAGNEIITQGETGILVPRNNAQQLAQQIIHLLQHPEERSRLAENAFQRYTGYYHTGRMCRDTAVFYREIGEG